MSCDNVITVQDLETDKKHSTFYREVITGKAGGTGADIDSATNAVTGQTQATLPKVLSNVGFSPAGFDFTTGGTLTERDKAIFYQADGNWYSWGGTLPKVVPPASSPASTGGIADNAWNVSTSAFMYRDWEGFTAELLAQAGIVDDGSPDEIGASQRVDAMRKIFSNVGTVADITSGKFKVGNVVCLTDRYCGLFNIEVGGTPNGFGILSAGGLNTAKVINLNCVNLRHYADQTTLSTNCAGALQAALYDAVSLGSLFIPDGTYVLKDKSGAFASALALITGPVRIYGGKNTNIFIDADVDGNTDVFHYTPASINDEGLDLENINVYEMSGTPARDVLRIQLSSTKGLKRLKIKNSRLRANNPNGLAVNVINNISDLSSNGLSISEISDQSELHGGLKIENCGDSVTLIDSVYTGEGRGIDVSMLPNSSPAASSARLTIARNNMTPSGEAIFIKTARGLVIEQNNIEQVENKPNQFMIHLEDVDGFNESYYTGVSVLKDNKIQPSDPSSESNTVLIKNCENMQVIRNMLGSAQTKTCLKIENSKFTNVEHNEFYISDGVTGIDIDANCINTDIGRNYPNVVTGNGDYIVDNGVGTSNSFKTPALLTNYASYFTQTVQYYKLGSITRLSGALINTTSVSQGDVIFTLASQFRPQKTHTFSASVLTTGGVLGIAVITVETDGRVIYSESSVGFGTFQRLTLDEISFKTSELLNPA